MNKDKKYFGIVEVIIIIIVTGLICGLTTGLIIYNGNKVNYTDLSNNEAIKEFLETYVAIMSEYYEDVDEEELINSAINGMMNYLGDDYTTYLTKEQKKSLEEQLAGEYEGIGVQITEGNTIHEVFADSPAEKAGIKAGDIILKINGDEIANLSTSQVASKIKSTTGKISIELKRDESTYSVSVNIEKLNIPSVTYEVKEFNNKKIGYIYISTFSNTTASQVEKALTKLEKESITSLIIDVRDNTGGYLVSAKEIASLFLEKGKAIYSLEAKEGTKTYKDETAAKRTYPIAVITTKGSASASEILAAALKESYGAIVVGETSFGKGKVQQTMNLDNGSMIKYTSAKWLTPNGTCIDGIGIKPDYEIVPDYSKQPTSTLTGEEFEKAYEEYIEYLNGIYEQQLNKALEVLAK